MLANLDSVIDLAVMYELGGWQDAIQYVLAARLTTDSVIDTLQLAEAHGSAALPLPHHLQLVDAAGRVRVHDRPPRLAGRLAHLAATGAEDMPLAVRTLKTIVARKSFCDRELTTAIVLLPVSCVPP